MDRGDAADADQATDRVTELFSRLHRRRPAGVWQAPGRVNLIGEHTDYNGGFVAPLALGLRTYVAAAPAAGSHSTAHSAQQPRAAASFPGDVTAPGEVGGWAAYVAGVFWAFRQAGYPVGEVDVVIDGHVPRGAGLSSSAALECAVTVALAELHELDLSATELAALARAAENGYVGAPTGVMDQMVALHGRAGHLVVMDTRSLAVHYTPLPLARFGLALLVIDTRTPHALVDGQYASRRLACESAAAALGVPALRDVDIDGLDAALLRLSDPVERRRVRHVVTENARVLTVAAALDAGADPRTIGSALTASHLSLRDDFEVSNAQLDLAVATALDAGGYGARMTGGGFGGCAIALVDAEAVGETSDAVAEAYRRAGFAPPATFTADAAAGAGRLG